jgi:3-oxoadipate enol-lactonase
MMSVVTKKRVRGIEFAYEEYGQGAALVLLHGFPFNRSMWREQIEALSSKHRVITPDLRGHGETEVTASATMEEMADDVAALLDTLEVKRAVVGGLSMGGYVALAFARKYPERLQALILADTRSQADTEEARANREKMAERALKEGMATIAEMQLPKLLAPETRARKPETVKRVREMIAATRPEGAVAALCGMKSRQDQTDLLSQIKVPTLIIVGREDELTPPHDAEVMHKAIKNSRLVNIPNAGHVSNIENALQFNHALQEFLGALEE